MPAHVITPVRINVNKILFSADRLKDVLTYESDIKDIGYAASKDELLIVTSSRGYLRVKVEELSNIIPELNEIAESIKERRRY